MRLFCTGDETRISTHALREEGDSTISPRLEITPISTHALREEGDEKTLRDTGTD